MRVTDWLCIFPCTASLTPHRTLGYVVMCEGNHSIGSGFSLCAAGIFACVCVLEEVPLGGAPRARMRARYLIPTSKRSQTQILKMVKSLVYQRKTAFFNFGIKFKNSFVFKGHKNEIRIFRKGLPMWLENLRW